MAGRDSGGDIIDMAAEGTTVPQGSDNAAQPRYIKSVPNPAQDNQRADPNELGATTIADAASNADDIPRTVTDTAGGEILTGTGDALPSTVDSKRLHSVPGGVTNDPNAKGSMRYTKHIAKSSEFETGASDGPQVDRAPGDEDLSDEAAMDKVDDKQS